MSDKASNPLQLVKHLCLFAVAMGGGSLIAPYSEPLAFLLIWALGHAGMYMMLGGRQP